MSEINPSSTNLEQTVGSTGLECIDIVDQAVNLMGEVVSDTASRVMGMLVLGSYCVGDCSRCKISAKREGGKRARGLELEVFDSALLGCLDFLERLPKIPSRPVLAEQAS